MMKNLQGLLTSSPTKKKRSWKGSGMTEDQSIANDSRNELYQVTDGEDGRIMSSINTPEDRKNNRFLRVNVLKTPPQLVVHDNEDDDRPDTSNSPGIFARRQNSRGRKGEENQSPEQLLTAVSYDSKEEPDKKGGSITGNIRGFFNRRRPTQVKDTEESIISPGASDDLHEESEADESERADLEEIFQRKQASVQEDDVHSVHSGLQVETFVANEKSRRGRRRSVTRLIAEARKREEEKAAAGERYLVGETAVVDDNMSRRRRRSLHSRPFSTDPSPRVRESNVFDDNEQNSMRQNIASVSSLYEVREKGSQNERKTRRGRRSIAVNEDNRESGRRRENTANDERKTRNKLEKSKIDGEHVPNDRRTKNRQKISLDSGYSQSASPSEKTYDKKIGKTRRSIHDDGGESAAGRSRGSHVADRRTRGGQRYVDNVLQDESIEPANKDVDLSETVDNILDETERDRDSERIEDGGMELSLGSIFMSPPRRSPSSKKQNHRAENLGSVSSFNMEKEVESQRKLSRPSRRPSESSKTFRKNHHGENHDSKASLRSPSKNHSRSRSKSRSRARSKSRPRARSKSNNRDLSPTRRRSRSRARPSGFEDSRERARSRSRHRLPLNSPKKTDDRQKDRYGDHYNEKDSDAIKERNRSDRKISQYPEKDKDKDGSRNKNRDRYPQKVVKDAFIEREFHTSSPRVDRTSRQKALMDEQSSTLSASSRSYILADSASSLESFLYEVRAGNRSSGMEEASRDAHTLANQINIPPLHRRASKNKNKLTSYLISDEKNRPKQSLEIRSTFTSLNKDQTVDIPKSKKEAMALLTQDAVHTSSTSKIKRAIESKVDRPRKNLTVQIDKISEKPIYDEAVKSFSRTDGENEDDPAGSFVNKASGKSSSIRIEAETSPRGKRSRSRRVARTSILNTGIDGERQADILLLSPESRKSDPLLPEQTPSHLVLADMRPQMSNQAESGDFNLERDRDGAQTSEINLVKSDRFKRSSAEVTADFKSQVTNHVSNNLSATSFNDKEIASISDEKQMPAYETGQDFTEDDSNLPNDSISHHEEELDHGTMSNKTYEVDTQQEEKTNAKETQGISLKSEEAKALDFVSASLNICEGDATNDYDLDSSIESEDERTAEEDDRSKMFLSELNDISRKQVDESLHSDIDSAASYRKAIKSLAKVKSTNTEESAGDYLGMPELDSVDRDEASLEGARGEMLRNDSLKQLETVNLHQQLGRTETKTESSNIERAEKEMERKRDDTQDPILCKEADCVLNTAIQTQDDKSESSETENAEKEMDQKPDDTQDPILRNEADCVQRQDAKSESLKIEITEMDMEQKLVNAQEPIGENEADFVVKAVVQTQDDKSEAQELVSPVYSQNNINDIGISSITTVQHNTHGERSTNTFDAISESQEGPSFKRDVPLIRNETTLVAPIATGTLTEHETTGLVMEMESKQSPTLLNHPDERTHENLVHAGLCPQEKRKPISKKSNAESYILPTREQILSSPVSRSQERKKKSGRAVSKKDDKHTGLQPRSREHHSSSTLARKDGQRRRERETNSPDSRKSSWRPPRLKEQYINNGDKLRKRHSSRRIEGVREVTNGEDGPVLYKEEDVFTFYSWSGHTQDADKIQRERFALRDAMKVSSFFCAYENVDNS